MKMKKAFNKIWIGILAVATVIVGACCSQKGTDNNEGRMTKSELQARISELRQALARREGACVYGSPEIIEQYAAETQRMRHEMDSLQNVHDNYDNKK